MKSKLIISALLSVALLISSGFFYKKDILAYFKARGVIQYTTDEALELAYKKCDTCHEVDKITNYCFRCGPPFVVVVHNMRTLIAKEKARPGKSALEDITDAQAIAITEVWNALIGSWESNWRKKDLVKLLEGDQPLIDFLDTKLVDRKIETALKDKSVPGAQPEIEHDHKSMNH